jgi:hypothetical protein
MKNRSLVFLSILFILTLSGCLMVESKESAVLTRESTQNTPVKLTDTPTATLTPSPRPTDTPVPTLTFTPTNTSILKPSDTSTPPVVLGCIQRVRAVNVRELPDNNSRRTGILTLGQCVDFFARTRDLSWVKFSDGWVQSEFFELSGSLTILPILEE